MNEEEKKAVEFIRDLIAWDVRQDLCPNKEECKNLEILLNLIEKTKKENEKLKDKLLDTLEGQKVIKEETPQYIKENYIPVEKVKDKIEELKQEKKKYGNCLIEMYEDELVNRDIKILQELLESEE